MQLVTSREVLVSKEQGFCGVIHLDKLGLRVVDNA
jgi:hypothetical protein